MANGALWILVVGKKAIPVSTRKTAKTANSSRTQSTHSNSRYMNSHHTYSSHISVGSHNPCQSLLSYLCASKKYCSEPLLPNLPPSPIIRGGISASQHTSPPLKRRFLKRIWWRCPQFTGGVSRPSRTHTSSPTVTVASVKKFQRT